MATRVFTMVFQGSNDPTFATGVLTLTAYVRQGNTTAEMEGEEEKTWSHRYGKANTHRRTIPIVFDPTSVIASDWDNGHYEAFMELNRKAYKRIVSTTLPRVSRTFDGSGVVTAAYSIWNDPTRGLLKDGPWLYELNSVQRGDPDENGMQSLRITVYSPTPF